MTERRITTRDTGNPANQDPENYLFRPFQGGADGLSDPPTLAHTYGKTRYADGAGPNAGVNLPQGTGSGLSGLPAADAGNTPPLWAEPDSAPPKSREPKQ